MASTQSSFGRTGGSTEGKVPLGNYGQKVDKPTNSQIMEMCGMLKVRSSMLALGACERVKKIARHHNNDIAYSSILPELVNIVSENPDTPLAAGAISALCTIAMTPDGRQRICVMGGAPPVIKMVAKADMSKPNTEKGVVLLMNLAADAQNRRAIREAGGVEALVKVMSASALDTTMESVIGALHNVLLSDGKGKQRAMDAGIAVPLARILAARLSESSLIAVRVRMLVSDLLRVPDIQERIRAAAEEKGFTLPGMPGYSTAPTATRKPAQVELKKKKKEEEDTAAEEAGDQDEDGDSEEGSGSDVSDGENVILDDD